jgi:tRNA 2-thiouridine synthesizing protein A
MLRLDGKVAIVTGSGSATVCSILASAADFQAFCRETGHALLAFGEEGGVLSFTIRRRAQDPAPAEDS